VRGATRENPTSGGARSPWITIIVIILRRAYSVDRISAIGEPDGHGPPHDGAQACSAESPRAPLSPSPTTRSQAAPAHASSRHLPPPVPTGVVLGDPAARCRTGPEHRQRVPSSCRASPGRGRPRAAGRSSGTLPARPGSRAAGAGDGTVPSPTNARHRAYAERDVTSSQNRSGLWPDDETGAGRASISWSISSSVL
jgi:hypothetical protein